MTCFNLSHFRQLLISIHQLLYNSDCNRCLNFASQNALFLIGKKDLSSKRNFRAQQQQQQQQQVYFQVKYSLHVNLVPAISEDYSRRVQEKKGKFHNRYIY